MFAQDGGQRVTLARRRLLERLAGGGALLLAGCLDAGREELPGDISVKWVSETATGYGGNHHAIAVANVDGGPVIGVPLNGQDDTGACGVVALNGTGEVRWRRSLPSEHCTPHAVGDLAVGEFASGARPAFLTATETRDAFAYDAATGEETFREELLNSIGFSAPVPADLDGDGTPELVVVDFEGSLAVARPDGSVAWSKELEGIVYDAPIVADLTGDGSLDVAVNHGRQPGVVVCFDGEGEPHWRTELERVSITWSLVESNEGPALAAATGGDVVLLDGPTGEPRWTTSVGERAMVGDSDAERAYATARDGKVRALGLGDGAVAWTRRVTDEDVRMPAPALGAVAADGAARVLAAAYDGTVAVLDAESGELLARQKLDASLYTQPVAADVTGDGADEILVLYGDGRVAALSYEAETN